MNVLIGYDGADCCDAALRDLMFTCLPRRGDAVVFSVADVWPPPQIGTDVDQTRPVEIEQLREAARALIAKAVTMRKSSKAASIALPT